MKRIVQSALLFWGLYSFAHVAIAETKKINETNFSKEQIPFNAEEKASIAYHEALTLIKKGPLMARLS